MPSPRRAAFTLVEMGLVLVIVGLITGGVLTGQSLIRAAELRNITAQESQYATAFGAFQEKYRALPGDMPNATKFWGAQNADPATCRATPSTGQATCDGNGDSTIGYDNGVADTWEGYRAWQHLANAGLIEGTYDGTEHGGSLYYPGVNVPKSRFSTNAVWALWYLPGRAPMGQAWDWVPQMDGHFLTFGGTTGIAGAHYWYNPILKPENAYNIDKKLDDGMPFTGNVESMFPSSGAYTPNCATAANVTAGYNLTYASAGCILYFRVQ